jgi:hypothetical protein
MQVECPFVLRSREMSSVPGPNPQISATWPVGFDLVAFPVHANPPLSNYKGGNGPRIHRAVNHCRLEKKVSMVDLWWWPPSKKVGGETHAHLRL